MTDFLVHVIATMPWWGHVIVLCLFGAGLGIGLGILFALADYDG